MYLTHRGWAKINVPELTLLGIEKERDRLRHTAEALDAIYTISPPWLQKAINLARSSVQRRGDLVLMHKDMVNLPANTIIVLQQKTRNYANPVFIEVDMHEELRAAVIDCLSDRLAFVCPYLLHDRPARMPSKKAASKPHHLAITPDHLTKTFAEYRDKSGVYDHLTAEEKPSFHDIRALGLYVLKNKYNKEYAQALRGHTSAKMTEEYFKGHEPIKPVHVSFIEAKAN